MGFCQAGSELEDFTAVAQSMSTVTLVPGSREERKGRTWDEEPRVDRECRHGEPGFSSQNRGT